MCYNVIVGLIIIWMIKRNHFLYALEVHITKIADVLYDQHMPTGCLVHILDRWAAHWGEQFNQGHVCFVRPTVCPLIFFFFLYHFDPAENVSTMTSSSEQVHERTRQHNVQKDSSTSPQSRAPEKWTETQGSHTFWTMYFHNCCMTFKIWFICITFTGLKIIFADIFMFSGTVGTLWISQQAISEWGILENYTR